MAKLAESTRKRISQLFEKVEHFETKVALRDLLVLGLFLRRIGPLRLAGDKAIEQALKAVGAAGTGLEAAIDGHELEIAAIVRAQPEIQALVM
jgi:hypothetical protein